MENAISPISTIKSRIDRTLWETDPKSLHPLRQFALSAARLGYAVGRDVIEGQLSLRAMSLVYTTLLSIVPLLAISFSVLKGLGVQNQLEPTLMNFLQPFGDKGVEIGRRIIEFVNNVNVKALGSVGLALLLYTIVSLMHKIEWSFNYVWRVSSERTLSRRFSDYLSVIMIGPLLIFSSLGVTTALFTSEYVSLVASLPVVGVLIRIVGALVPYLMVLAAFTFIYVFMPNTKVRMSAAVSRRDYRGPVMAPCGSRLYRLCGEIAELCGDLFGVRRAGHLHDLALYRLADPAYRREHRVLLPKSRISESRPRLVAVEFAGPAEARFSSQRVSSASPITRRESRFLLDARQKHRCGSRGH